MIFYLYYLACAPNNGTAADSRISVSLMNLEWRSPLMPSVGRHYIVRSIGGRIT
jgi:hypothetical protein